MAKADHPSKIVPSIMKEIAADWDWRKRHAPPPKPPAVETPVREIGEAEQAEVKAMMADLARKLSVGASNA